MLEMYRRYLVIPGTPATRNSIKTSEDFFTPICRDFDWKNQCFFQYLVIDVPFKSYY